MGHQLAVMKRLPDHVILYDADCPLCRLYTGAFVRHGWLEPEGRRPFQTVPDAALNSVDTHRAQDEIALLDLRTGTVHYGIDSLARILSYRWPGVGTLVRLPLVAWLLQRLYRFISSNRKVIAAVRPHPEALRRCSPQFSLRYRLFYLAIAWLLVALVLTAYAPLLAPFVPVGPSEREWLIGGGQLLFQLPVILWLRRTAVWNYLGHLMTVSLMGALVLLPLLVLNALVPVPAAVALGWFLLTAGGMLLEHLRRTRLLGLGLLPSLSWVLYRLLVLGALLP